MFNKVGLIAKKDDERVEETVQSLIRYLVERRLPFVLDSECATVVPDGGLDVRSRESLCASCDLIIVIGGDGTLLNTAHTLSSKDVRMLGINLGRLGFLTDISRHEMTQQLDEVFAGRFQEEERFLLHVAVVRDARQVASNDSLNDVVVHRWRTARLITLDTYVDGSFVNTQRSDGLIVSTPTGSTAYALSGGGPILHPALNAIVLVPICPHTLSNRPIVVDADGQVEIVISGARDSAQLTCDGQTTLELTMNDRIVLRKKEVGITLIHPTGYDYYATLRTKLHWGKEL
ncbi:MAG: NAD(+) kinase [Gammaproteobacteria bacterium]|nr:NAD(+) kinase [Gammaproteobacteria bacterium]